MDREIGEGCFNEAMKTLKEMVAKKNSPEYRIGLDWLRAIERSLNTHTGS